MGTGLERALNFCLAAYLLPGLLQGLEIPDPREVEYIWAQVTGVAGGSVTLGCGSTLPSLYIWGYTHPGSLGNRALAYDYGHGPKVQRLPDNLGHIQVPLNTSSLAIERLQPSAGGLYTCQALYDSPDGPRVAFYYTQLEVLEDWEPGSASV